MPARGISFLIQRGATQLARLGASGRAGFRNLKPTGARDREDDGRIDHESVTGTHPRDGLSNTEIRANGLASFKVHSLLVTRCRDQGSSRVGSFHIHEERPMLKLQALLIPHTPVEIQVDPSSICAVLATADTFKPKADATEAETRQVSEIVFRNRCVKVVGSVAEVSESIELSREERRKSFVADMMTEVSNAYTAFIEAANKRAMEAFKATRGTKLSEVVSGKKKPAKKR